MYEPFLSSRNHYEFFEKSCLEILNKARYRRYPVDFSVLSDFDDEDLKGLMDIGTKYSSQGSYADAETVNNEHFSAGITTRDFCDGFEDYSKSNATSTSWATAVITAAESAYSKENEGSNIKFSLLSIYSPVYLYLLDLNQINSLTMIFPGLSPKRV